jgi:hypothetical protein
MSVFDGATWRKSSRSQGAGGDCVEVAMVPGFVGVRDSKQDGEGPILVFTPSEWGAFIAGAVDGEFTLPA